MKTSIFLGLLLSASLQAQENFRWRAHKHAQLNNPEFSAADVKAEIEFGKGLAGRILKKYPLVQNETIQEYVNAIGSGTAAQVGRPELVYYFAVVDTPDVNAYACPGGYIFLTKGLVDMLDNEAELVGVIAHEIVHVNERHVIKKLKIKGGDDSLAGIGAMIGGATAALRVAVKTLSDEAMNVLFNEGLMESEELSSDRGALATMVALGYDSAGFRTLLDKIEASLKGNRAKVLDKTHPNVNDRRAQLDEFEKTNKAQGLTLNKERFDQYAQF